MLIYRSLGVPWRISLTCVFTVHQSMTTVNMQLLATSYMTYTCVSYFTSRGQSHVNAWVFFPRSAEPVDFEKNFLMFSFVVSLAGACVLLQCLRTANQDLWFVGTVIWTVSCPTSNIFTLWLSTFNEIPTKFCTTAHVAIRGHVALTSPCDIISSQER